MLAWVRGQRQTRLCSCASDGCEIDADAAALRMAFAYLFGNGYDRLGHWVYAFPGNGVATFFFSLESSGIFVVSMVVNCLGDRNFDPDLFNKRPPEVVVYDFRRGRG